MATKTISQLTAASALAGTEVLPIVQGGTTKKVTAQAIADLASGGSGGGIPNLDVITVGTLGSNDYKAAYTISALIPKEAGTRSIAPLIYPSISINGGMGFTGTLSSISFPTATMLDLAINNVGTLVTVNVPALTTIIQGMMFPTFSISYCSSLTTIDLSGITTLANSIMYPFNNNALSQATVDHILVKFAATTATGATLNLSGGTNATPSATGLAAKATLEARGWTVQIN